MIADEKNIINSKPIQTTLLAGLNEDDFFDVSFGARKGLVDKEKVVPESGTYIVLH